MKMSEPKFTKAPWLLADDGSPFVYALNEEGNQNRFWLNIARGFVKGESGEGARVASNEVLANAQLIAAAPDLYAALDKLLDVYVNNQFNHENLLKAEQEARAALKKAGGE